MYLTVIVSFSLLSFVPIDVEGYFQLCDFNKTIFASEESTATFLANFTYKEYFISFHKPDRQYRNIFVVFGHRDGHIAEDNLYWKDSSWKNRTHISSQLNTNNHIDIRIDVSNISMADNGTYELNFGENVCFVLFVMQIRLEPSGTGAIEENTPVFVYAHPHASVITRPFANATMVWLFDGLSANQTASFIQQDGLIWIPHITRGLDGRNVTYRAVQDNGNVNEVNFILDVTYGPSKPLTLVPGQTQYYLVSGDLMPDITCTSDCKPPCSTSWGKYSRGGTLSLGIVTPFNTGEYTCTATRTGVKTVERTVNIYVADNPSFTIAIACLATVQALTTLGLGLWAFHIYRRNKQSPCQMCFNTIARKSPSTNTDDGSNLEAVNNHGQEHYEDLDPDIRRTNKVYDNPAATRLEVYENTTLSSSPTLGVQQTHI
ncbi:uncharacterized protein LOC123532705 isoform X1 [Mercenaria mercenaria]|uniref:uncharacterized protein LOC123532705 isoform X1 n=1 Tax=Mercenaria mercenaria TaxID=6596 RepID=UPI00234E8BCF|nr:uncharacterized protein LOC123532705 isoform X1 [Mercenaria mercenaria]